MRNRSISIITENRWHNGFLGNGHKAMAVLDGVSYKDSDPFILFMDDVLDLPGGAPVGGAHPHAGFETLTLVLEGNGREWKTGSFELMTAGKGIVHTEEITSKQKLRILQVWLALPPEQRHARPFLQKILLEDVPTIKTGEYEIRVYSGSSNGLVSPLKTHTPFILIDFRLKKLALVNQDIPLQYHGLIYVLQGRVKVGDKIISSGQAGWLERTDEKDSGRLSLEAPDEDTHFVLYAGQPHHVPVVQHEPFVADSVEEIAQLYRKFKDGQFPHLNDLSDKQKITYHSDGSIDLKAT